jgi:histidyl-tRNA synthetase
MDMITAVRGFKDILPQETGKWRYIEETARNIFSDFGFREIRVPILEKTALFKRSIGELTDIVEKEMYTFLDRSDEYITLRPEATASIIRAYLEHSMYSADPVAKLFTIGPMFRRERPQKGRYRQFHQINVESIGLDDPRIDAEIILMLTQYLERIKIADSELQINSLGCTTCRPDYRKKLTLFLRGKENDLCEDCRRRIGSNPLRILDCKRKNCIHAIENAPNTLDFVCPGCDEHFKKLQEFLNIFGIPFVINTRMVRGLDYYTKTTFEIVTESLGAQNAIAGGGRYDGLVRDLGGPDVPGTGFALGCERILSLVPFKDDDFLLYPDLFIAAIGDDAEKLSFILCNRLRLRGVKVETDYAGKSLKSQMKKSDKLKCRFTLMLGKKELMEKVAVLRDMQSGMQEYLTIDDIEDTIVKKLQERK